MDLKNVSTKDLVEELSNRAGVRRTDVEPYDYKDISVEGPAIILVVID